MKKSQFTIDQDDGLIRFWSNSSGMNIGELKLIQADFEVRYQGKCTLIMVNKFGGACDVTKPKRKISKKFIKAAYGTIIN